MAGKQQRWTGSPHPAASQVMSERKEREAESAWETQVQIQLRFWQEEMMFSPTTTLGPGRPA